MFSRRKRQDTDVGRALGSIRPPTSYLIGSSASPLEFGRFFLSSAGIHLVLAWAVMTVGLHRAAPPERPLVVKLVEAEAPRPSPPIPQPARARPKPQGAAGPSSEPEGRKEIAPRDLIRPSVDRPVPIASGGPEITSTADVDERRQFASRRAADELVKELGLPGSIAPSSGVRIVGGAWSDGPKAVGTPGRVALAPGASAEAGSGPALIGDGLEGARQGSAQGGARRGVFRELIPHIPRLSGGAVGTAGGGGPRGIGRGTLAALPPAGGSAGPTIIGGSGGGEGAGGPDGRGRARLLGAEITIPIAPTVTVSPRQGGIGRVGSGGEARAAGGGFARPDYGANLPPKYPPLAREKGYEGTVYLRALIERDGRVGNLAIDRSSGYEILDRAAVDSVREWAFLPAQKDGKPVASWVLLPVKFVLK